MANRKQQIRTIQRRASELSDTLDNLITELEEAYGNMPEGIQDSERGERAQQRIDTLSEWRDQLSDMAEDEEI